MKLLKQTNERGEQTSLTRRSEDVVFNNVGFRKSPLPLWHENSPKVRLISLKQMHVCDPRMWYVLVGSFIWTGFTCFIIYRTVINPYFRRFSVFFLYFLFIFKHCSVNTCTCVYLCIIIIFANAQTVSPEVLRQYGLSLLHSHIVLLTRTRACPLEPHTPSPPVPRWKLIRRPKKMMITDEPRSACERKMNTMGKSLEQKVVEGKREVDAEEDIKQMEKQKYLIECRWMS